MAGEDNVVMDNETLPDRAAASWYLVQYTADLRKREPRNVGVLLEADGQWTARFFAETDPGKVNGRRIRQLALVKDSYEAWISYYRRKMSQNRWEDVERLQAKKPTGNFSASLGGKVAMHPGFDWERELARLFEELVLDEPAVHSMSTTDRLKRQAAQLFERAEIAVERDVTTDARLGDDGPRIKLPFDFSFMNGQLHLAEAVPVAGWQGEQRALAFNATAKAVRAANAGSSFLAFYDRTQLEQAHEDVVLAALEGVAHTIDISEADEAVETLREIAHHD